MCAQDTLTFKQILHQVLTQPQSRLGKVKMTWSLKVSHKHTYQGHPQGGL